MGNQLRALREQRGLSLRELGRQAGIDYTVLSKIENGSVRLASHHIEKLVPVLECTPEALVSDRAPLSPIEIEFLSTIEGLCEERVRKLIDTIRALRS